MSTQPQDNPSLEPDLEPEIRNLAYHLWQTAGRDFSQTALDFWAMAEPPLASPNAGSPG